MAAIQDFLITGLSLRSRPEAVYVGGLLQSRTGEKQRGADAPQPAKLAVPDPGLTADVHLTSVLNSVAEALFQRPDVQTVENVMILTKDVPPGTPPSEAVTIRTQRRLPDLRQGCGRGSLKANNPKVTALRIKRPPQPPEFAVDARGFLVAIAPRRRDRRPRPRSQEPGRVGDRRARPDGPATEDSAARGAFSYQVETPAPLSHRVKAKIEDFSPSPTSQVLAINDDESKSTR